MTEFVLEILDGDRAGETVPLPPERITLGRRAGCTVQLNDEKVSGQHAEIVFEDGRYVLRDLGSTNGTLLDGRRVDEIVLSGFDTFQVGRVRLQFRERDAVAPEAALALHRVDHERLSHSKRRRGVLGLVVAVVLLGAAGAFYSWQLRTTDTVGPAARRTLRVERVAGNKLPEGADSCEVAGAWDLAAGGAGFDLGGPAHSGSFALAAERLPAAAAGEEAPPGAAAPFALARLHEPVRVAPGERLRLAGQLQTAGAGRGALRLRFGSSVDDAAVWSGTAPAAADAWESVVLELAAPPGMDRVQVELLALLPEAGAEVRFDDLALVTGGDGAAVDLSAAAANLVGTGTGVLLRAGGEPVLHGVAAAPPPDGPLHGLAESRLLCLSDAGRDLAVTAVEDGFRLACGEGGVALAFARPVAAAGALVRGGEGPFALHAGDFEADGAQEVLLGAGAQRVLVRAAAPGPVHGARDGERFVLTLARGGSFDLVVAFEDESRAARAALQEAKALLRDRPGAALERLGQLVDETPHDSAVTEEALRLRADLVGALGQQLDELRAELDEAEFFRTRGGYERIGAALGDLVARYGEQNLPEPDAVKAMRAQVASRLGEIDAARAQRRRADLQALAAVFGDTGEEQLAQLVRDYIERHYEN